jgi:ParB family transcriptional regulator, chromosome partitioning protein
MRLPWSKPKADQLELLDADPELWHDSSLPQARQHARSPAPSRLSKTAAEADVSGAGRPLLVRLDQLSEDPNNPRTEFPEAEIDELADDVRQRGILQPLVVHPADAQGRHRLHFGAKRLRAALRAGLSEVPVVVRDAPADAYDQVAENQKRHALTPADLARFIKGRVDAGEPNAEIARRLSMNLTTVAHHLSLLDRPPELDLALKTGRCTSPRTLHELSKLHETEPDKVRALVGGDVEITRSAVAAMKAERSEPASKPTVSVRPDAIARAHAACGRLEQALAQIERPPESALAPRELVALRIRVQALTTSLLQGSDRQTLALRKGSDSPTPARPT